jgi:hypothetical protein
MEIISVDVNPERACPMYVGYRSYQFYNGAQTTGNICQMPQVERLVLAQLPDGEIKRNQVLTVPVMCEGCGFHEGFLTELRCLVIGCIKI